MAHSLDAFPCRILRISSIPKDAVMTLPNYDNGFGEIPSYAKIKNDLHHEYIQEALHSGIHILDSRLLGIGADDRNGSVRL
jgi:hypothetical protein